MHVSLIAAMARNRVIGRDNRLPWKLPNDMKYFRAITAKCPIIMGRKTFDSIGRLLPNRTNIVVTKHHHEAVEARGAKSAGSLDGAIGIAKAEQPREIFIIGGGEIYNLALHMADKVYLTRVEADVEGDAFFPHFEDSGEWKEASKVGHPKDAEHEHPYTFLTYERKSRA